ncbi:MAG: hypothetical protein V7698_10445, partial [Paracoccaceae bacterium]
MGRRPCAVPVPVARKGDAGVVAVMVKGLSSDAEMGQWRVGGDRQVELVRIYLRIDMQSGAGGLIRRDDRGDD